MTGGTSHIAPGTSVRAGTSVEWLDLDSVATVTLTAGGERLAKARSMWSADCRGEQMIEIRFRRPTAVRRLRVVATETEVARTQEMTVWVCLDRGERHREVVRQQFNFSPDGATEEVEEYSFEIDHVSAIQLRVVPSIDGRTATARVIELRRGIRVARTGRSAAMSELTMELPETVSHGRGTFRSWVMPHEAAGGTWERAHAMQRLALLRERVRARVHAHASKRTSKR